MEQTVSFSGIISDISHLEGKNPLIKVDVGGRSVRVFMDNGSTHGFHIGQKVFVIGTSTNPKTSNFSYHIEPY